ncbi:MAG: O-methyltransferase [Clostridia bacterium]|nr:O-methyltransferase [Clostridia bacterium]MBR3838236.1 O-methyltransferase [Clostridia bacterium]
MDNKLYISQLRDYAQKEYIPIIRADSERFMDVLMNIHKPLRILEIGTAIGYSSICMAMALQQRVDDFHIDTIEIDPEMVIAARKNIENCGFSHNIRVICGDCLEVLPALTARYDFVFMDAAKGQYSRIYEDCLRLLRTDGILLCDNCTYHGKLDVNPAQAPHKHRTIIANMQEFHRIILNDDRLSAVLLEVGDGMILASKKR